MRRLGKEKGLTLIEVLIALVILGAIAGSIFVALNISTKSRAGVGERTVAESLVRSQLEYIKDCPYDSSLEPGHPQYAIDPSVTLPDGYDVVVTAARLDPEGDGTSNDDGIQKITVEVYHQSPYSYESRVVLSVEGYKVER